MNNRAKCKLCKSIIQSYHGTDYVMCDCGEIALDGGDAMRCYANDLANVIRVDDEGNEIIPKIVDKTSADILEIGQEIKVQPSKSEMIGVLSEMIKGYEALPRQGMDAACTNADMLSSLLLIYAILKSKD